MYQSKDGQAIHQNMEDNNIRFNNKMNNKNILHYVYILEKFTDMWNKNIKSDIIISNK